MLQNTPNNTTISYKETFFRGVKMDRITKGFLEEFSTSFGFTNLEESLQFEHFANYCALSYEAGSVEIDIQEMSTGDSAQGIDGKIHYESGTEGCLKCNRTKEVSHISCETSFVWYVVRSTFGKGVAFLLALGCFVFQRDLIFLLFLLLCLLIGSILAVELPQVSKDTGT